MLPQTRDEAVNYLLGRINYERQVPPSRRDPAFKLNTMREFAARMGQPQLGYPVIHVAGTKGKGSTSAMIASILQEAGYRVGLYTSPHLHDLEERLVVDRRPIDTPTLVGIVQQLKQVADGLGDDIQRGTFDGLPPTFFELITMAAWLFFRQSQVDVAVAEVGMGGRLDSTNICQPQLGIITSISKDHVQQLGHTLAAIAFEKAGIIKPGMKVLSGVGQAEAREVIRRRCDEEKVELLELHADFTLKFDPEETRSDASATASPGLRFRTCHTALARHLAKESLGPVQLGLAGEHQHGNAALAISAALLCREFGLPVEDRAIQQGLLLARPPGRIEFLPGAFRWVVDVAHNPAAIEALVKTLRPQLLASRSARVVVSISEDKELEPMLQCLAENFDTIVLTAYQENPRAASPDRLAEVVRRVVRSSDSGRSPRLVTCATPALALEWIKQNGSTEDLTVVTGSTFLVSEMRSPLLKWNQELAARGLDLAVPFP